MAKKPYFPNNWSFYNDIDSENFVPHTFEEVMDWKVGGWELPSSVDCIIRTTHLKTKKVKEHVYKRRHHAENKILQLMQDNNHDFCVTTHDAQHFIGHATEDDE